MMTTGFAPLSSGLWLMHVPYYPSKLITRPETGDPSALLQALSKYLVEDYSMQGPNHPPSRPLSFLSSLVLKLRENYSIVKVQGIQITRSTN